jgi:conjugative transfer signal peptidase TraF
LVSLWQYSRRHPVLTVLAGTAFIGAVMSFLMPPRWIVWNDSESLPIGFYMATDDPPAIGTLIEFQLPSGNSCRASIASTGEWFLLKPIAAGPGDLVDTSGHVLRINGKSIAPIHRYDSTGQPLPRFPIHRVLQSDEFFVFSDRVWNSFDSRYFGPVHRRDIVLVRRPLWTW